MFALRPVAFPLINVVFPEFVNNKLPDEYEIPLLYHVSRGPVTARQTTDAN